MELGRSVKATTHMLVASGIGASRPPVWGAPAPKTVETRLHSVYRKLDATARWQLAAKLGDEPVAAPSRVNPIRRG
jgi:hypothetical protein